MNPIIGQKYYRNGKNANVTVIQVTDIQNDWVIANYLREDKKVKPYRCLLKNFNFFPLPDPLPKGMAAVCVYNGCKIYETYVVLNTKGEPYLRCSEPKAKFYLKRGYAKPINEKTIQMIDNYTENKIFRLYNGKLNKFFMAVKNDKCVCCGKDFGLSQHHVVPKRHKSKINAEIKKCISNVLFLCVYCHQYYESISEPDVDYTNSYQAVLDWKNHFIHTMNPKFLPEDWDIFCETKTLTEC